MRDALLDLPIKDIDIATPERPKAVMAMLRSAGIKALPTGLQHGTITAVTDSHHYEITTLRVDIETDGRRATVEFTEDWQADAERRDFTINALYADLDGTVYDYVGGVEDLKAGRVRFIGDPYQRIDEDALRILRFFRFNAWYGHGELDEAGLTACWNQARRIKELSGERLQTEILSLLGAPKPDWDPQDDGRCGNPARCPGARRCKPVSIASPGSGGWRLSFSRSIPCAVWRRWWKPTAPGWMN